MTGAVCLTAGRSDVPGAHLGGLEHQWAGNQQAALLRGPQHVSPRGVRPGRGRGCCCAGAGAGWLGCRLAGGRRSHQLSSECAPVAVGRSHGQSVWDEAPAGQLVVTATAASTGGTGDGAAPLPLGPSRALCNKRTKRWVPLDAVRGECRPGELELPAARRPVVQVEPDKREFHQAQSLTCTKGAPAALLWQAQRPTPARRGPATGSPIMHREAAATTVDYRRRMCGTIRRAVRPNGRL